MEGTWNKVAESRLEPGLFGQSCVEHKGSLYVFGGCDRNGIFYNTLYCWDMSTLMSTFARSALKLCFNVFHTFLLEIWLTLSFCTDMLCRREYVDIVGIYR